MDAVKACSCQLIEIQLLLECCGCMILDAPAINSGDLTSHEARRNDELGLCRAEPKVRDEARRELGTGFNQYAGARNIEQSDLETPRQLDGG